MVGYYEYEIRVKPTHSNKSSGHFLINFLIMIQKIIVTADISEKTTKFFGCKETDTMTFTKVDDYFILSLGCTEVVVANLKITPSTIEFITIDVSGEGLLRFHNGELSIYEKDDKLLEYLRTTSQKFMTHLSGF